MGLHRASVRALWARLTALVAVAALVLAQLGLGLHAHEGHGSGRTAEVQRHADAGHTPQQAPHLERASDALQTTASGCALCVAASASAVRLGAALGAARPLERRLDAVAPPEPPARAALPVLARAPKSSPPARALPTSIV
jgi:hypothetical protein